MSSKAGKPFSLWEKGFFLLNHSVGCTYATCVVKVMFLKVIELSQSVASTLQRRLFRAAVSADFCQFQDIHGNTYLVCHGTAEGQVCFSGSPVTLEYVLEHAYLGAGCRRGDRVKARSFNLICCHAAEFQDEYLAGVDYTSDPVTGKVSPGSSVKAQHVFKGLPIPKGTITQTEVVGNRLVIRTI